jgi:uracil-DNA glycosylase/DNA polymerase I-like protein with 3'-5' exonuclease and polymerase domains
VLCRPEGPIPSRIMIVGEAPGYEEEQSGRPFQGASGIELNKMLGEAGITRNECFITNVVRQRPPGNDLNLFIAKAKKDVTPLHRELKARWILPPVSEGISLLAKEISMVKPNVIVALGNTALWALTGIQGITKWRGSMLYSTGDMGATKVIPTLHPAAVLRQWSDRAVVVNDLRRASRYRADIPYPKPAWRFIIRPDFSKALECLNSILQLLEHHRAEGKDSSGNIKSGLRLSFDLETRGGHIACAGLSWSLLDCICIPFIHHGFSEYWSADQEAEIIWFLWKILSHPNAQVVGQNILYDSQYTWRHWNFVPNVHQDCMISQHAIYSALPKSLAFQASMYCQYYVYWKDEGKNWNVDEKDESAYWYYNCEDCVYTDEGGRTELDIVKKLGLEKVHEFQQKLFWPVLQTMQRGVRIDLERREKLISEVHGEVERRHTFIKDLLGHPLNPNSPKQMQALFYGDLGIPPIMTRAKKGKKAAVTLNDDALQTIARKEPLVKPLINAISDIRTMGIFLSHFLETDLDEDQRMRCAYNIGGSASGKSAPVTYRLSSSENAFGSGGNLQAIPSEKSKSLGKAAARGSTVGLGDPYSYPNIRSMFIPDPGYTFFDGDLDRADLQVVVWEADDQMLKAALGLGVDIHLMNAYILQNKSVPDLLELAETHPKYLDWRRPMKMLREFAKVFCHGTNYGGQPRTMAANTGWLIKDVERAQALWFGAHPGIKRWHDRVKTQVHKSHFIENRFGYRWYIFDRIDSIIPEAIAWVPQSTVSVVINKIWMRVYKEIPEAQVLLQTHDSLEGQVPTPKADYHVKRIEEAAKITIPYEDPLIIPFSVKTSEVSWGDCK